MKRAVMIVVMLTSVTAFAGKRERDFLNKEVAPAVKTAEVKFKEACGCALKITVDEASYKDVSDMGAARGFAEEVAEDAPKYCTDEASKKAVCQMKTLEIARHDNVDFTFKAGKGRATTNRLERPSWDMVTAVLDK